jgi:LysM repeat protein
LAFIIVIGILLSDHLTSTTEPPQATLASAGSTVRQAINTPGGAGSGAPVLVVAPPVAPQQPVATQGELTAPAQAVRIVHIGGPAADAPNPAVEVKSETPAAPTEPDQTAKTDTDATGIDPALAKAAASNGETLVPVGTHSKSTAGTTYVAQAGDSVSKIASRLLGSASQANIAAFVKANPSLDGDPANLQAGRTYKIPATAVDPATAGASVDAPTNAPLAIAANSDADDAIKTATVSTSAKAAGDTVYVYTVKPGDNLTKIARDELGDMHAVASIQELNSDKLKGTKHDIVLVGMKLRLPGKPVANAQ